MIQSAHSGTLGGLRQGELGNRAGGVLARLTTEAIVGLQHVPLCGPGMRCASRHFAVT